MAEQIQRDAGKIIEKVAKEIQNQVELEMTVSGKVFGKMTAEELEN